MRQLQELMEKAQFVHQLKRGRMNRIAAKIAEEIGMFFQHHNGNSGACQKKSKHHSGRAASDVAHCVVSIESAIQGK